MENTEEKLKRKKEIGLREHALWRQSALRGHRMIGQYLINRYGLTDEDFELLKRKRGTYRAREFRKREKEKKKKKKKGGKEWINKNKLQTWLILGDFGMFFSLRDMASLATLGLFFSGLSFWVDILRTGI